MMPVPWKLWEGQIVEGSYPLRRYLGGSDRSAVFLTQYGDAEEQNAVIKLVLAAGHDSELLSHWERAEQLRHPNLLRLLRRGSCQINQQTLHYAVMEYAEENLAEVLAERPLTAEEARAMLPPLLDALSYIHSEGLVHGHIKPSNIMAVGDRLKLPVDGVSRVGDLGASVGQAGPYDPPEIDTRGCSPIGDVWSFGMTLVEVLTLRLPVMSGPKDEPVLPATLPPEFLPLVRACLRVDPRRRAPLDAVQALLREPAKAPVAAVVVEPAPPRRKWLSLALVSVAAVAVAAILAVPRILNSHRTDSGSVQVVTANAATPGAVKPELQPTAPASASVESAAPAVVPDPAPPPGAVPERVPEAAPVPAKVEKTPTIPSARAKRTEAKPEQVVHQVMPAVTEQARRTIHGKVTIKVLANVDAAGHVASASIESQNSKYFGNLTLKAVEQWGFAPGDAAGQWELRFVITTKGTEVIPTRIGK